MGTRFRLRNASSFRLCCFREADKRRKSLHSLVEEKRLKNKNNKKSQDEKVCQCGTTMVRQQLEQTWPNKQIELPSSCTWVIRWSRPGLPGHFQKLILVAKRLRSFLRLPKVQCLWHKYESWLQMHKEWIAKVTLPDKPDAHKTAKLREREKKNEILFRKSWELSLP